MLRLVTWWGIPIALGAALPTQLELDIFDVPTRPIARAQDREIITDPDTGRTFVPGEKNFSRTVYNVVALTCVISLAMLLGFRAKALRYHVMRKRNFTSILIVILFILGISFIVCVSVVQTGEGLRNNGLCHSAALICLIFYTSNKLAIYIFLLERARIIRSPFMPRLKDYLWLVGMTILIGGFGTIAIIGYIKFYTEISKVDGLCRFELPQRVSFSLCLLIFDVVVNILLTGVFFWLLRPVLSFHGLLSIHNWFGYRFPTKLQNAMKERILRTHNSDSSVKADLKTEMNKNIKILLLKCLLGSMLVMLPAVANLAQFYMLDSRELAWVCLTICTLDVSWGVIIVNWLTIGSAQAETNFLSLVSQSTLFDSHANTISPIDRSKRRSNAGPIPLSEQVQMRDFAAITADTAALYGAPSLHDEGGLLGNDGARDAWDAINVAVEEPGRTWKGSNTRPPRAE